MPISGATYRFITTPTGKKIRLAFKGGKSVEARRFVRGKGGKLKKGRFLKRHEGDK